MAKKLEGSQATAKHMKQVTNEPHYTQINLLRHQRTGLPPSKAQRRQNKLDTNPISIEKIINKPITSPMNLPGRSSIQLRFIRILKDVLNVEIPNT